MLPDSCTAVGLLQQCASHCRGPRGIFPAAPYQENRQYVLRTLIENVAELTCLLMALHVYSRRAAGEMPSLGWGERNT